MSDIGIVIVTYNSSGHIGPCLDAAIPTGAEVVVVDNASSDATLSEVAARGVRVIANSVNRGFAAAVNQGISALDSPYVLLLNPDAVIIKGVEALRAACDLPGSAAAGGALLDSEGRPQTGFMVRRFPTVASFALEALLLNRIWPGNPVNRRYRCLDLDYAVQCEVEQPAGAFLMIRRDVWLRLGGLDESFVPLWFEDVDYCLRMAQSGFRVWYVPQATARHCGGHSIPKIAVEMRRFYWYRNLIRFAFKHFPPVRARVVCLAVMAGSAVRMVVEPLLERSLKPVAVYGRVMRGACRCLWLRRSRILQT